MEKFIITPREDKTVTMTIRIDRTLQEQYNDLSSRTNTIMMAWPCNTPWTIWSCVRTADA